MLRMAGRSLSRVLPKSILPHSHGSLPSYVSEAAIFSWPRCFKASVSQDQRTIEACINEVFANKSEWFCTSALKLFKELLIEHEDDLSSLTKEDLLRAKVPPHVVGPLHAAKLLADPYVDVKLLVHSVEDPKDMEIFAYRDINYARIVQLYGECLLIELSPNDTLKDMVKTIKEPDGKKFLGLRNGALYYLSYPWGMSLHSRVKALEHFKRNQSR